MKGVISLSGSLAAPIDSSRVTTCGLAHVLSEANCDGVCRARLPISYQFFAHDVGAAGDLAAS